MKLIFDRRTDQEIIFRGHIVMSRSEKKYLTSLVEQFKEIRIESVLEVGYGLGISAGLIQNILKPAAHHIVEIEDSLYRDCMQFSRSHAGARAMHGDYAAIAYPQSYDLLFFDPYDYQLALNRVTAEESYTREFNCEVRTARKALKQNGFLCHTFFGDCPPPELAGFTRHDSGHYAGPAMTVADGTACSAAHIGYYTKSS